MKSRLNFSYAQIIIRDIFLLEAKPYYWTAHQINSIGLKTCVLLMIIIAPKKKLLNIIEWDGNLVRDYKDKSTLIPMKAEITKIIVVSKG